MEAKVQSLRIVDYDTWKPREQHDLYDQIPCKPGVSIKIEELSSRLALKPGRTTGLTSLVFLETNEFRAGVYRNITDAPWVHFPLIDMDLEMPDLSQNEQLQLIKKEIKEKTEIERGVILASGREGHYHFMGTERLLTEDQWPIFVGLCLCMLDPNKKQLVDTKWAAHTLTPMKYLKEVEVDKDIKWSAYDFKTMFATLRIVTGEKKPRLPVVVDVL